MSVDDEVHASYTRVLSTRHAYEEAVKAASWEERPVASTPRDAALPEQENVAVAECPHCHRTFLEARLAKHAPICQQAQARKRAKAAAKEAALAESGKVTRTLTLT